MFLIIINHWLIINHLWVATFSMQDAFGFGISGIGKTHHKIKWWTDQPPMFFCCCEFVGHFLANLTKNIKPFLHDLQKKLKEFSKNRRALFSLLLTSLNSTINPECTVETKIKIGSILVSQWWWQSVMKLPTQSDNLWPEVARGLRPQSSYLLESWNKVTIII